MLGIETDQDTWEAAVAEHAERGDFIVQEYIPIPEEMFPTIEDEHVQMRLKRFNINPYCIGGRVGMMTRISDQADQRRRGRRRSSRRRGPSQAQAAARGGRQAGRGSAPARPAGPAGRLAEPVHQRRRHRRRRR